MRILIVEDDPTSSLVLATFLAPVGEAHIAKDGEAGLSAFRDALHAGTPFDLVCLDIMMPVLDGQTVLREIRAQLMFYVKKFGLLGREQSPDGTQPAKHPTPRDYPGKGEKDEPWVG